MLEFIDSKHTAKKKPHSSMGMLGITLCNLMDPLAAFIRPRLGQAGDSVTGKRTCLGS